MIQDPILRDALAQIKQISEQEGHPVVTLSVMHTQKVAQKTNHSLLDVEIAALKMGIVPTRYQRNLPTISVQEQVKLLQSCITIVGCGGLGGTIIEQLARLGIGHLVLVDGDIFNESNLNRQLLSHQSNLGQLKAQAAAARIKKINASIQTQTYSQFANSSNIQKIIQKTDLVIDALDNIPARFTLQQACRNTEIPLIHGAVNGFNGQVSTIFPNDKGFEGIYGPAERYQEKETDDKMPKLSVTAMTPTLIAALQAQEALKVLLKKGQPLQNKLLFISLEENEFNILPLEK